MLRHLVDGARHPLPALVQVDLAPVVMCLPGIPNGLLGRRPVHPRWALDRRPVDGGHMVAGSADPRPVAADQVQDAVRLERLRCH